MTKDEALDLALEALIYASSYCDTYDAIDAITAIKQARALDKMADNARELGLDYEPVQEPVAWATQIGEYAHIKWGAKRPDYPIRYEVPLYTSPQPAPIQQDPVAVVSGYYGGQCVILPIDPARIFNSNTALYTKDQL